MISSKYETKLHLQSPERVLAIYLTYRGFGYVILDEPDVTVDWAHLNVIGHDNTVFANKITQLITNNAIDKVLTFGPNKRPTRIQENIKSLRSICKRQKTALKTFSKSEISNVFEAFGSYTKYERATLISKLLPDLLAKLPPKRRAWDSEDLRMSIFEAASLALVYFYLKK